MQILNQTAVVSNPVENNNELQMKKLPSIMIQNGEPDSPVQDVSTNISYDSTYLNPSNTLDSAVAQNNSRLLEKLLTSAANISLEGQNASGGTPIHEAAYQGKLSCLRVFLKFGANVNLRDREGWTPLHAAICGGDANSVLLLLKHGASINATANDGIKPIDMAIQSEDEEITKALLQADRTSIEKDGPAPLASAEDLESDYSL
ncbi:Ankyrin repeat, PH and SEC7 domain containing protein secG [Exaiptasia diaphana]|nr:Ankyrin repeat, PH and SEC7 domain containing protein secG [Exaiptasia diaphana]